MVFAAGVIVLAVLLSLAARHRSVFATVFHVTTGVRVLVVVLRSYRQRRGGNCQRRDTDETHE